MSSAGSGLFLFFVHDPWGGVRFGWVGWVSGCRVVIAIYGIARVLSALSDI